MSGTIIFRKKKRKKTCINQYKDIYTGQINYNPNLVYNDFDVGIVIYGEGMILDFIYLTIILQLTYYNSPHDEHRCSGPRPVKLCSYQYIFQFLIRTYIKMNSIIWFGPVNSNFHFKDCNIELPLPRYGRVPVFFNDFMDNDI